MANAGRAAVTKATHDVVAHPLHEESTDSESHIVSERIVLPQPTDVIDPVAMAAEPDHVTALPCPRWSLLAAAPEGLCICAVWRRHEQVVDLLAEVHEGLVDAGPLDALGVPVEALDHGGAGTAVPVREIERYRGELAVW